MEANAKMSKMESKAKMSKVGANKKSKFPHTLVIILCLILFAGVLTYVVPAGVYDKVENSTGRMVVDSSSYHRIEQNPITFFGIFKAIPTGMQQTAWIAFVVLIVGGAFSMIENTGAIQALLGKILKKTQNKSLIALPIIILTFAIIPTFIGGVEAYLAFVPIGILVARSMGYDAMVGLAIILAAANVGFAGGLFNPFTVGTAHEIIGLPLYSALWFRVVGFVLFYLSVTFWTVKYALKIKKNPEASIVYELEQNAKAGTVVEFPELTPRYICILLGVVAGFGTIIYAALHGWSMKTDVPAICLIMTIAIGLLAGYSPNKIATEFINGAKKMVVGAMIVGFARGISVVLADAQIVHTIVHGFSSMLVGLPKAISGVCMYLFQIIINCFIISGSGQAATTIPIMSPLGDVLGLTQQTVVAAFQYGDGITNLVLPLSAATMGSIAIAGIEYPQYLKFIWRIILTNLIIGGCLVSFAAMINLGPF